MSDSVGKIMLDLEVISDLGGQIVSIAGQIASQLQNALAGATKGMFDGIEASLKSSMEAMSSTLNASLEEMQKNIKDSIASAVSSIKGTDTSIPTSDTEEKPTDNGNTKTRGTRAPPKTANLDAVKAQMDNTAQKLDIVNRIIEQQQAKLNGLKEAYNNTFNEARKNKLEEQILATELKINKLINSSDKLGFTLSDLDEKYERLSKSETQEGAAATNAAEKGAKAANEKGAALEKAASKAGAFSKEAKVMNEGAAATNKNTKAVNAKGVALNNASGKVGAFTSKMNGALGVLKGFFSPMKSLGNSAKTNDNNFRSMQYGIAGIARQFFTWMIVLPLIMKGLSAMTSFLGSALMTNKQFAASVATIRSNLYTAFMPVYNAILPAINTLMQALATATSYIASFMSQIFGSTYQASFNSAKAMQSQIGAMAQAEKQAKKTASSLGGVANASKKVADENKRGLASFDEINELKDPTASTPKTTTPAGGGVVSPITPTANMAPIEAATAKWAAEFKRILAGLWAPFKQAWAAEGVKTIAAAKHALQGIEDLIGSIAKSFYEVWTNGTGTKILKTILQIWQDIFNIIGDVAESFAKAWNKGNIGTKIIQGIADTIENLLTLIKKIGDTLRTSWGEVGDNVANVFMKAIKNTIGVLQNLSEKLVYVWDNGGSHLFDGFVKLGAKIIEVAGYIFNKFITPIANGLINILAPAFAAVLDAVGYLVDGLNLLLDKAAGLWNNTLVPFGKFLQGELVDALNSLLPSSKDVKDAWDDIKTKAQDLWNNTLVPFGEFLAGKLNSAWNTLTSTATWLWKNILVPMGSFISQYFITTSIKPLATIISDVLVIAFDSLKKIAVIVWKDALVPLSDFISSTFHKAVEGISTILKTWWDNILSPLGAFLKNSFLPAIQSIADAFMNLWEKVLVPLIKYMAGTFISSFKGAMSGIKTLIGGLRDTFNGIIDFITGVFTANWSKAWEGVKEVFKGIFESIKGIATAVINGIIGAINGMIDALNKLSIKVPKGVPGIGGTDFGFNISHIPYLARGGIIDQPTLAMVGEAGKEAVVPLENTAFVDTLAGAVANSILAAMQFSNSNNISNRSTDDKDVILQIDGTTIARVLGPLMDKEKQRIGNNLIVRQA